jgi:hypothetical protein
MFKRARDARRTVQVLARTMLVLTSLVVATAVLRFMYAKPMDSHNFGTVQTRFGTAGVVCGGDAAPRCGQATGLAFAKCTPALMAFFGGRDNDAAARELLDKRPPTGDRWNMVCGLAPMIRGAPAKLESN